MLSQVSQLTGLEPHVIQNWVKRGFVSPPRNKRYSRNQFSRIALINMLKDCLRLDQITRLLSYLNGHLDDESDDIIDESRLYTYITRLVFQAERSPWPGGSSGGRGAPRCWRTMTSPTRAPGAGAAGPPGDRDSLCLCPPQDRGGADAEKSG